MTDKFVDWLMSLGGEGKYLTAKWYAAIFAAVLLAISGVVFIAISVGSLVFVVYKALTFVGES